MCNSKLHRTLSYCNFYNYWMCFHVCFCFTSWYSSRNFKLYIRLNICVITAGTKKYKSISKKKKKKHDRIVLLSKSKLNSIEVLISTALIHLVISHDQCVLINNVLKEYNKMDEEMKVLNSS